MMNKKIISMVLAGSVLIGMTGCTGAATQVELGIGESPLVPVDNYNNNVDAGYTDAGVI